MPEIENKGNRYVARRVPDSVFRNRKHAPPTAAQRVMAEHAQPIFISVNYPPQGGMEVLSEGWAFPKPGDVDPFVLADVNAAKQETMGYIDFWSSKELLPVYILLALFTTWRQKINLMSKILNAWCRNIEAKVSQDFLEYDKYQPMIYELITFIKRFLIRLGFSEHLSLRIAENLMIGVEFDDQYYLKLYDLFNEIPDKTAMAKDPRKELLRIIQIGVERSKGKNGYFVKFEHAARPLLWALRIPRVKSAFIASWDELTLDALWPDDNVLYHSLKKTDYNYGGKNNEERLKVLIEVHKAAKLPFEQHVKVIQ